jgi:hypothetical protein
MDVNFAAVLAMFVFTPDVMASNAQLWVTVFGVVAGILVQALVGHGMYKYFQGKVEGKFGEIDSELATVSRDIEGLKSSERRQWDRLDKHGSEISYLQGKSNGKAAGHS